MYASHGRQAGTEIPGTIVDDRTPRWSEGVARALPSTGRRGDRLQWPEQQDWSTRKRESYKEHHMGPPQIRPPEHQL